jgi:hypothetical protein
VLQNLLYVAILYAVLQSCDSSFEVLAGFETVKNSNIQQVLRHEETTIQHQKEKTAINATYGNNKINAESTNKVKIKIGFYA